MVNGTHESEQIQIVRLQEHVTTLKEEQKEIEKWTREQVQRLYDKYDAEINRIEKMLLDLVSQLNSSQKDESKKGGFNFSLAKIG